MKRKMLPLLATLLLVGGGFAACDDSDVPMPYTEYYSQPSCWNLDYDSGDRVALVNSDEEFQQYFMGVEFLDTKFSPVDFSKHTLVLIYGTAIYGIQTKMITKAQQVSSDRYTLNVEITLGDATVISRWVIAVLTDKVSSDSEIELKVNTIKN